MLWSNYIITKFDPLKKTGFQNSAPGGHNDPWMSESFFFLKYQEFEIAS